jgi:hypothetical protein
MLFVICGFLMSFVLLIQQVYIVKWLLNPGLFCVVSECVEKKFSVLYGSFCHPVAVDKFTCVAGFSVLSLVRTHYSGSSTVAGPPLNGSVDN